MKGLNKILLVTAIAAAPLAANAELTALNDTAMGNLTGQAGVTIELSTKIDIGQVVYTDEGSLDMNAISIGGSLKTTAGVTTVDTALTGVIATIDITAAGNAVIDINNVNAGQPIDFAVTVGSVALRAKGSATEGTQLASNINLAGKLGWLNITVANEAMTAGAVLGQIHSTTPVDIALGADAAANTLIASLGFSIDNLNMDIPFLAVGVKGLSMHGAGFNAAVAGVLAAGGNPATDAGVAAKYMAAAQVLVSKGANARATSGEALHVQVANFNADLNIAAIEIGGASIGSLAINNLAVTQTDLYVYGH